MIYILHDSSAAGYMRGVQVSDELNKDNIYRTVCYKLDNYEQIINIYNSIVLIVRILIPIEYLLILKQHNNTIIYDIVDYGVKGTYMTKVYKPQKKVKKKDNFKIYYPRIFLDINNIKNIDYLIVVNNYSKNYISKYILYPLVRKKKIKKRELCKIITIYHHWDPNINNIEKNIKKNIEKNIKNELSICYIGQRTNTINCAYLDILPEVKQIGYSIHLLNNHKNYNCHYNIRNDNTFFFNFKSNVKLSTASVTNSNIITTKDESIMELINHDYPYLTNGDINSVKQTIEYAKNTYNTEIWFKGLEEMERIKYITSLPVIIKSYKKLFNIINKKLQKII
jgi:hypothetical protein